MNHFDTKALGRLERLREELFAEIEQVLAEDGHCKPYEGAFAVRLPNYFEEPGHPEAWTVELDCYVVGPRRHYRWVGPTLDATVAMAEQDVRKWIAESVADRGP